MHTDEAVHASVLGAMLEQGVYRYNPQDGHGPTLYYLAWPVLKALGVTSLSTMEAWHLRIVSAAIGAATILILGLLARDVGRAPVLIAGTLIAVSAPLVYYQRYFIHEGLFLFLTLLTLICGWRFFCSGALRWAVATGFALGLLLATKETAPLSLAGMVIAGAGTAWKKAPVLGPVGPLRPLGLIMISAIALGVAALLYSSFGTNGAGLRDAASSLVRFTHRAGGEGHEKPCWTYLAWLLQPGFFSVPWSGWIILAFSGLGAIFRWDNPVLRLFLFYALAEFVIYSVIPYKTPWLELNILGPLCLPAGVGMAALIEKLDDGGMMAGLGIGLIAATFLFCETDRLCFLEPADARNPLAYSPTVHDIEHLSARVGEIAAAQPPGHPLHVQVIGDDYWPLPWYLRHISRVGYWSNQPPQLDGDIIITSPDRSPALLAALGPDWSAHPYGLRAEVLVMLLTRDTRP